MDNIKQLVAFIRDKFNISDDVIQLHSPYFKGNERKYVLETLENGCVSSVGNFVNRFEEIVAKKLGVNYAIATNTGTAALHLSLIVAGVKSNTEVITQSLSFIATANAISYCGAIPVFLDVDKDTLGLCVKSVRQFLEQETTLVNGIRVNKKTKRRISAVVPMHTFGLPMHIKELVTLCRKYALPVIEDSAEALGSKVEGNYVGTFGELGVFSFNGNKTITSGGGGMIITNNESLAQKAKHLSTTAKKAHDWEYNHDSVGYNYRMPNLNAALAFAQFEQIDFILQNKRTLAKHYADFCGSIGLNFVHEIPKSESNYWMNALILKNKKEREQFLKEFNKLGIKIRPVWSLIHKMPMYKECFTDSQKNALWFEERIINLPSSIV